MNTAEQSQVNPLETTERHGHRKIKIGISGAAETGHCGRNALELGNTLGREIARAGGVTLTGAISGFPLWVAKGAKEESGIVVGMSPAASEQEHLNTYRMPVDYMDLIIYTGFGHAGRELLFTRSCDAIIVACGRIGTIHEFTIAFEDEKPIGILEGDWETDVIIRTIIEKGNKPNDYVVFDADPARLVARVMEMVERKKAEVGDAKI